MKLKNKVVLVSLIELVVLLLLPLVCVNVVQPQEFMGSMMLFFFIVNPITSAMIHWFMGNDIKTMWWLPIAFALVFLVSYWLILREIVWDLTIYAVVYLLVGFLSMLVSWVVKAK